MFDPDSRYYGLPTARLTTPDGRTIQYKVRRFLPQGTALPTLVELRVRAGDRLDLLAARTLDDPALYWRICDANDAMNPHDLTASPGAALKVPSPQL